MDSNQETSEVFHSYRYSIPVPPQAYEGLDYFCRFPPRIHRNSSYADDASWQCQIDFLDATGAGQPNAQKNISHAHYAVGNINPRVGNLVALCGSEVLPERLALISYCVEYGFIHDDIMDYTEDKSRNKLWEKNRALKSGINPERNSTFGTKEDVRNRQLQARMAVELLKVERELGNECINQWDQFGEDFFKATAQDFESLDEYLEHRIVDGECKWTMCLLRFGMKLQMTKAETEMTATITTVAYKALALVNDYFSWEKEWQNYQASDCKGGLANTIFLYMKWYSVDATEAKKMLRSEIMARELEYCNMKAAYLGQGNIPERTIRWLGVLESTMAGNFLWSITTARYNAGAEDSYPGLRAAHRERRALGEINNIVAPVALEQPEQGGMSDEEATSSTQLGCQRSGAEQLSNISPTPASIDHQSLLDTYIKKAPKSRLSSLINVYGEAVLEPCAYLESLPSKGIRNSAIDALETWYHVPEGPLMTIREIIKALHSSSLMIDDIEDNSLLRRGFPATHTVFGIAQTINSANMLLIKALKSTESLSPAAVAIFSDKLLEAHTGQGLDLYWTHQSIVPTIERYLDMVDGKTGGLFRLAAALMRSEATVNKDLDLDELMTAVGRFFQIRDDYQNLDSEEYTKRKGFCDDIGEGKLSLPLIHTLQSSPHRGRLLSILQQRKFDNGLSDELRNLALDDIRSAGGLVFARDECRKLEEEIERQLSMLEKKTGVKNWIFTLILLRLHI